MVAACCVCDVAKHDKFGDRQNHFNVGLIDACCTEPGWCLYGYFCPPCASITFRRRVLQYDMTKYTCCQGYFSCCSSDDCGSTCPNCCLCLEAFCCLSCSMSASRWYLQDQYQLRSDPCDQRIICCQQVCVLASCICSLIGICCEEAAMLGNIFGICADCMFLSIMGCMTAQMQNEIKFRQHLVPGNERVIAVVQEPAPLTPQGQTVVDKQPKGAPPVYTGKPTKY